MHERDRLVGLRIKEARQTAGLTQADLAQAVGVSRSAVAQWETGRTGQVGSNLTKIASILGVSAGTLLEGSTSDPMADSSEMALLRLYRACSPDDRAFLVRTAVKLARMAEESGSERGGAG